MNSFLRFACFFLHGGLFPGLFLLLFTGLPNAAAQNTPVPYVSTEWHSDHGLPHDSVHAIVQTRDGYLWIGTRRGIVRFDGVRFITPKILASSRENISSLYEDKDGGLWIGTAHGPMRVKDGKVVQYGPKDGVPADDVRAFFESKDGSIWIGRAGGLSQFKEGTFRNFTRSEGLPHSVVRSISEDELGNLWIATDGGICQMRDGVISNLPAANELGTAVRIVYMDPAKNLWVGAQAGLFKRTGTGWEHFNKSRNGLSDDFVDALHVDQTGQLWIGSYGGLNRLVNGKIITEITSEGTGYDLVNCIMEDREGNVWIGSKEGVARLKARPFTAITKQQGLTYNNVMSVLEDKVGTVWCGTWGGGVFQLVNEKIAALTNQVGNNRILALCEGRDGSMWFGTDYDTGLHRLKDGVMTHFGEESGVEKIAIRVIHEDRNGTIWIGTVRSLASLKDGKFTHYRLKDGLAGEAVKVIFEDKEGALWIGTSDGLSRYQDGKFTNFTTQDGLSHNTILALYEDQDNTLWIGTGGGGLNRFRNGKFTSYTTRQGLFNDDVLEILEDDHGYLWMSCLKGVFRVNKAALQKFDRGEIAEVPCIAYGKEDGMLSVICGNVAKPAAWKGSDGRLWFPTTKGLAVIDPATKVNELPPPVVIEEIIADKKRVGDIDSNSATPKVPSGTVHLPPGRGEWEIHYTALSFQAAAKNRFKYKLEGVDPDWVEADTRRVAYYNNIAPGSYTFHVTACNNNGIWNETGAKLRFTLQPHYWQTWWFQSLGVMGSLSVVAAGARYATKKRMQLKLERIEQQHAIERERTRIAKDIHDDLGASLTRITFLGELAETDKAKPESVENYVRRIVATARDTVRSLDEIVWAVNPRRDTLNSLVEYVAHYSGEFLEGTNLRCRLDLPDSVPDISLSSEVRHSLFLVIKEFLNNTVKHAQATEVSIRMKLEGDSFLITLQDDGCGFAPLEQSEKRHSNGLENMRKRVENLGGLLELHAARKQGTRVSFEVQLSHLTSRNCPNINRDLETRG